jgi:transposase
MLGYKARDFKPLTAVSLEDLVPEDNFYRQVDHSLNLGFIRDLVCEFYSEMGRPSIDPVVFFKLQLIAFFEGIRSERQLMETVNVNLAHRWFIGYDLREAVPDHSSLSKIRDRYGLATFQRFFERIVEKCIEAGLVWGEELYFDSTKVQANAAIDRLIPRVEWEAQQHLYELFENKVDAEGPDRELSTSQEKDTLLEDQLDPEQESATVLTPQELVEKYDGSRLTGVRKPTYERITDREVCPTDPDASPMPPSGGGSSVMGYRDHYIVDGGKQRIILHALVTPASIMDNTPMLDLVKYVCSKWEIQPKQATGDAKYGTVPNIAGLEEMGIKAYLPTSDLSKRSGFFPPNVFRYDREKDQYICPEGQALPLFSRRKTEQVLVYRAKAKICNACPVKEKCTDSKSGRYIFRSFYQDELDRAEAYQQTEAYQKAIRKRSVWVEPLFGEAKQFHRLERFRLRGLKKVNIEGVMVAAGQNIKRLIKRASTRAFSFYELYCWLFHSPTPLTFSTG